MNRHWHSARGLADSIVHANSYRQTHAEARLTPESPALIVALSRQVGAGGTSIATEHRLEARIKAGEAACRT